MPTVSVIVPVYNAEPWIRECADSILMQSYTDIQVVFVNDGSTDGSSGVIPRDDDRVSVSHTQHMGVAAARNVGLRVSTGELVAFCDADDYMEPDAIEKMVNALDGSDMVCGSFRKFGDFDMTVTSPTMTMPMKAVAEYVIGNLRDPRRNQMFSGCWAKLYRRRLVTHFPEGLTTAEDMVFNFQYLNRCKRVQFINDVVYHNRKHQGSLTMTFDDKNRDGLFGFLRGLREVRRFLELFPYSRHGVGLLNVDIEDALNSSKGYHFTLYFMRICQQTGLPMNEVFKRIFP